MQNRIKVQAHEHERFRKFAAKYGQVIHQLQMRMSVALLRDVEAEMRAKEKAEAPTVKTKSQVEREEAQKARAAAAAEAAAKAAKESVSSESSQEQTSHQHQQPAQPASKSVWTRKFRPLTEAKAVDLFADVVGDAFILAVGIALVLFEWWRTSSKPDANLERIKALARELEEQKAREEAAEQEQAKIKLDLDALREEFRNLQEKQNAAAQKPRLLGIR